MSYVLRMTKGVSVYIDDIAIFFKTWKEHLSILNRVFERLKKSGLKVKHAKCVWAAAEWRILGPIVSEDGIMPDPDKVSAVNITPQCRGHSQFPRSHCVLHGESNIGQASPRTTIQRMCQP